MTDVNLKVPSVSVSTPEPLTVVSVAPSAREASISSNDQPGLAIEQSSTGFVYKVLDRKTGDVIRQIPQQSLADLANDPSYDAGDVIKTSV
jgi:flagellar protein FlaG